MNKYHATFLTGAMLRHVTFTTLLEFGPIFLFLVAYRYTNIYQSTVLLMVATIISTIVTYRIQKRIPYLALYVAFITIIFGSMTLHFQAVKFIQMRDTLYDVTCALTLISGIIFTIPFLKLAFHEVLPMAESGWNKLTYLWIGYFIVAATLNEIVRSNFSVGEWFFYKSAMVFFTCVFGVLALLISYKPFSDKDSMQKSR